MTCIKTVMQRIQTRARKTHGRPPRDTRTCGAREHDRQEVVAGCRTCMACDSWPPRDGRPRLRVLTSRAAARSSWEGSKAMQRSEDEHRACDDHLQAATSKTSWNRELQRLTGRLVSSVHRSASLFITKRRARWVKECVGHRSGYRHICASASSRMRMSDTGTYMNDRAQTSPLNSRGPRFKSCSA